MRRIAFIVFTLFISSSYAQIVEKCATVTPVVDVFDGINLDSINKNFAMICHKELMDLRLTMTTQQVRGKKLLKKVKKLII